MKKVIVVLLIILAIVQFKYYNPVKIDLNTGHGIEEVKVTSNSIETIKDERFTSLHKTLYPNDKVIMFRYTLLDDIDSIEFYIGGEMITSFSQLEVNYGEIYILIKEDKYSIMNKEIEIIDEFTVNTVTSTISSDLDSFFPDNKECTMSSYSEPVIDSEIVFNQEIELLHYSKGFSKLNNEGENIIEEINLDVTVSFNKK